MAFGSIGHPDFAYYCRNLCFVSQLVVVTVEGCADLRNVGPRPARLGEVQHFPLYLGKADYASLGLLDNPADQELFGIAACGEPLHVQMVTPRIRGIPCGFR